MTYKSEKEFIDACFDRKFSIALSLDAVSDVYHIRDEMTYKDVLIVDTTTKTITSPCGTYSKTIDELARMEPKYKK